MEFYKIKIFWVTNFGLPDLSFGVHICVRGRLDIHAFIWMISIGNVPIYKNRNGKLFAASNSYHSDMVKNGKTKNVFRAGVPQDL